MLLPAVARSRFVRSLHRLTRLSARAAAGTLSLVAVAACAGDAGDPVTAIPVDASRSYTAGAVSSVSVSPGSVNGVLGQSGPFSATAYDAKGRVVTGQAVAWSSSDATIVRVDGAGVATAVGVGTARVVATISGVSGSATATIAGAAIASIAVSPGAVTGAVGDRAPFTATLRAADGTVLTGRPVVWTSSAPGVVSIDSLGNAVALASGTAQIRATSAGVTGVATATVTGAVAPAVARVVVSPGSASGSVGQSAQFTATAYDAAGQVLSGLATSWATTNPAVVTVTSTGYATAVGGGSANIVATIGGQSGSAAITVSGSTSSGTASSSTVSPSSVSLVTGATQQLTATVLDVLGLPLTGLLTTWSSSNPAVATVSGSGLVTAVSAGSATITANTAGILGTSAVTVTNAPVSTGEPMYRAGSGTLIWNDSFDGLLSTTQLLSNYVTLNAGTMLSDLTGGLSGSGALRVDWVPNGTCQDDSHLIERGLPGSREIYVQYAVRYTAGFVFDWTHSGYSGCTGNAKKLFFLWSGSGSRFDFISENHELGMGSDYDHPLYRQTAGPVVTDEMLGDGAWHRITIHVIQSSSASAPDGLIEGWIDGVKRWYVPNWVSASTGGWTTFKLPTTFNQGSPVNQSEWLDNLTIWRP